jgi:predicted ATPase
MRASNHSPQLVGREYEARFLGRTLDRIDAGGCAITLIEDEAGIGKTRLVQDTLAVARGRGIEVLVGGARELERTRPFGVVADVLECVRSSPDPRRAAIATLLTTHGGGV